MNCKKITWFASILIKLCSRSQFFQYFAFFSIRKAASHMIFLFLELLKFYSQQRKSHMTKKITWFLKLIFFLSTTTTKCFSFFCYLGYFLSAFRWCFLINMKASWTSGNCLIRYWLVSGLNIWLSVLLFFLFCWIWILSFVINHSNHSVYLDSYTNQMCWLFILILCKYT